jgi:hypothetical protein
MPTSGSLDKVVAKEGIKHLFETPTVKFLEKLNFHRVGNFSVILWMLD